MDYDQREGQCVNQWDRSGMHTQFLKGAHENIKNLEDPGLNRRIIL
jgi:hypothetical protein